jgi:hypothetical protein
MQQGAPATAASCVLIIAYFKSIGEGAGAGYQDRGGFFEW